MKKRLLVILLALCMTLSLLPVTAAAAEPRTNADGSVTYFPETVSAPTNLISKYNPVTTLEPELSANSQNQHYVVSALPNLTYLHAVSGGLERVECLPRKDGWKLVAERYTFDGQITAQHYIEPELPMFGGFFSGEDHNFVVFAQKNPEEDNSTEVFRVVKYSKNWERLGSVSLYGENTFDPLHAGSLRMAEDADLLYVYTCHQMYEMSDGLRHQSNMVFTVRKSDMTVTFCRSVVGGARYVSHSFNQFIAVDGDDVITLDQGDAHPRSVVLRTNTAEVSVFPFRPAKSDESYNWTGASLGGLSVTPTHYLVAGISIDQNDPDQRLSSESRNVFVAAIPKDNPRESAVQIYWLTDWKEEDEAGVFTPQLTALSDGRTLLTWFSGSDDFHYVFLKPDGTPDGPVYLNLDAVSSDCQPVEVDGKIWWLISLGVDMRARETIYDDEIAFIYRMNRNWDDYWLMATTPDLYCIDPANPGTVKKLQTGPINVPPEPTPTPSPTPTPKPTPTPVPTAKPTASPAPTAKPTATPAPTAAPTAKPEIKNPFKDVSRDQYYYDPVLWAVNHKPQITQGTSATTFSPAATCTRGQVVTFLWRAAGEPKPTGAKNPFTDVKSSDYFFNAVLWAVEKGITQGTSKTTFSPNDPCTRAHVVTFLWRSEGQNKVDARNPFGDVKSGDYYYNAVLWAVKNEITAGTSATTFSPANPCTRGQIVTFLYRDKK